MALHSMEAAKSQGGRYYRPELDVVRFVAFFLVFLHHTLPRIDKPGIDRQMGGLAPVLYASTNACGFGLSLFFTLSAFLICTLLLRERESCGTIQITQFYIRRILRIWPLYYVGLALGAVFLYLPGGIPEQIVSVGWFAVFLGAWSIATQHSFANPAIVLWSISVEEQFYLFAPWTIRIFKRRYLYYFCAVLILICNICLYCFGRVQSTDVAIWFNSLVQFECFAAGMLLCLVLRDRLPILRIWQRLSILASSWFCWFFACFKLHCRFPGNGVNPGGWALMEGYALAALGSVLLLVAFLGLDSRLLPRWAIYLGRISFGLYVYHAFLIHTTYHLILGTFAAHQNPIIKSLHGPIFVLNLLLTFALTILTASLSYRYIEAPFLKMKKRLSFIDSQPIAGAS
jgi:peptidoglycan/LPS O-acetylase OafA/YrhL